MSEAQASTAQMEWNEGQEEVLYRQVSVLALIAAFGALLSFLAFASPVLWIFPILGVGMAGIALYTIRGDSSLTGGGIATAALIICSFNCIAAPAHKMYRLNHMASIGRQHFAEWVELVRAGEREKAFELTQAYSARNPKGANLKKIYGPQNITLPFNDPRMREQAMAAIRTNEQELKSFFKSSGSKLLLSANQELKFVGVSSAVMRIESELITLHYHVPVMIGGQEVNRDLFVEMERRVRRELGESHWRVVRLSDPDGEDDVEPIAIPVQQATPRDKP